MSSYCRDRSIHLLRHCSRSAEPYYHSLSAESYSAKPYHDSSSGKRNCDCGLPCRLWQVECDNVQTVPCRMDDNEWWGYPGYVARVHRAVL
jgi:hypothetical protein